MLYAIRNDNGLRHYFEWNKRDEWESREALEAAIREWKRTVPPRMSERVVFEIYEAK